MSPVDPEGHGAVSDPERIVLIGFMAAGKTAVGRRIAQRLGWRFVDLDAAIEARMGRSPGVIIREDGEPAFRALEAELTAELAAEPKIVLAPGGGWATQPGMDALLGPGTVRVWLRVSPEEAVRRAEAEGTDRPLMGPREGRVARVARLLHRRTPDYETAEMAVDTDDREPRAVAEEVLRRLELTTGGE